jgi:hypothetical protein
MPKTRFYEQAIYGFLCQFYVNVVIVQHALSLYSQTLQIIFHRK